jgi:hypothetical protein
MGVDWNVIMWNKPVTVCRHSTKKETDIVST